MCYLSSWAHARSIYINGVKVDGAVNLRLTGVDVDIDAQGDVRIAAKNYKVNLAEEPTGATTPRATPTTLRATPTTTPPSPPRPIGARRYYVFTRTQGDAQWDIDVYVNGSLVRRFGSRAMVPPVEITRLMPPGDNAVRVRAVKQEGERTSMSPADYLEVVLGEGQPQGSGQTEIEKLFSYRRTAVEAGLFVNDATVTLR